MRLNTSKRKIPRNGRRHGHRDFHFLHVFSTYPGHRSKHKFPASCTLQGNDASPVSIANIPTLAKTHPKQLFSPNNLQQSKTVKMEMTIEAIIAAAALVVGLPPAAFALWKCWRRRRRQRLRCGKRWFHRVFCLAI